MLNPRWKKIAVVLVAFAAVLFLISFYFPAEYQICGADEYTHAKNCTPYHLGVYVLFWVGRQIDAHNGLFTAIATVIIAFFTCALSRSSRDQGDLTRQSIELGRQEFIATHRPKIIVRFIEGPFVATGGSPQSISITVANIGVNKATILEWGADLARRKGTDWVTPGLEAGPKIIVPPIVLISGERHTFVVSAKIPYTDSQLFTDVFNDAADSADREELCVVGVIRYADESAIVRETGFFRVYDPASKYFIPSKNPGEEYQD